MLAFRRGCGFHRAPWDREASPGPWFLGCRGPSSQSTSVSPLNDSLLTANHLCLGGMSANVVVMFLFWAEWEFFGHKGSFLLIERDL